jgi:hypothetical protein
MKASERIFECECKVMIRGIVFVALLFVLGMARSQVRQTDDWLHIVGTFSLALGLLSLLVIPGLMLTQDMVLMSGGLARSLFGVRSGHVTWDEITSVRCRDVGYKGAIVRHYALFTDERKTFPRLTVRSDYDDVEELLSVVSAEIANRDVPIVVRKMGWPVPVDRLPLPSDEPRSMW